MNFFKILLATILGFFISLGVFFILFLIAISVMMSSVGASKGEEITVEDNTVLELDFQEPLTDFSEQVYFEDFNYTSESFNGLNSVLQAIEIAKTDPHIKGISLKSTGNLSGIAFAQELRRALEDFKDSGKFVLAYNDEISQLDYYLQSVADKVYISQLGNVNLRGLSSEIFFYKDLQEKTGLRMEVIRHGKYKSAVEPFLENKMSDNNRLQTTELLNAMWNVLVTDIAKSRNLSVEKLNEIATNVDGRTAELAQQNGLIDGVLFRDEFEKILCEKVGKKEIDDVNFIGIEDYAESVLKGKVSKEKDKIAVIYPNCESHQDYKSIVSDEATNVFNGKIMVEQIAQKTNAYQQNDNILLSDKATVYTKPQLEIFADDVKCSHGCTVGSLSADSLFYLQTRGIGKKEASALLTYAFANTVLESVKIPALSAYINRIIAEKLGVTVDF